MDHNTNSNMPIYKIAKPILGFIYKLWYNPKIIGSENIPKDGSFLIVGNHVHLMDQCNVIIATKRHIHYLAKMEYFDKNSKEGKFAWFFRGCGCIPVDRTKKDHEATSMALDILKDGHVIGLYPEGTRNKYKEKDLKELYNKYKGNLSFDEFYKKIKKNKKTFVEYLEELKDNKVITNKEFINNLFNTEEFLLALIKDKRITLNEYIDHFLLPLKFGTVSMAHKTNSLIVPYAITGKYKFRSRDLTIRIGKPFKVDKDLEKANLKLDREIKKLIKESIKNSGK